MRLSLHPPAAVVTDPGTGNDPRPRAGRAGAELRQVITTRIAETRYPPSFCTGTIPSVRSA